MSLNVNKIPVKSSGIKRKTLSVLDKYQIIVNLENGLTHSHVHRNRIAIETVTTAIYRYIFCMESRARRS